MTYYSSYYLVSPYDLQHHGILGMKWGVRRYQNKDGTLTEAGKRRYGTAERMNAEVNLRNVMRDKRAGEAGKAYARDKAYEVLGKETTDKILKKENFRKATINAVKGSAMAAATAVAGLYGKKIFDENIAIDPHLEDWKMTTASGRSYNFQQRGSQEDILIDGNVQKFFNKVRSALGTGEYSEGAKAEARKQVEKMYEEAKADAYEDARKNYSKFLYPDSVLKKDIDEIWDAKASAGLDAWDKAYDDSMRMQNYMSDIHGKKWS